MFRLLKGFRFFSEGFHGYLLMRSCSLMQYCRISHICFSFSVFVEIYLVCLCEEVHSASPSLSFCLKLAKISCVHLFSSRFLVAKLLLVLLALGTLKVPNDSKLCASSTLKIETGRSSSLVYLQLVFSCHVSSRLNFLDILSHIFCSAFLRSVSFLRQS